LQLRCEALERYVPRGSRVLQVNAGTGRFTQVLHQLDCRISVVDESPVELESHRARAVAGGFSGSIESWSQQDIEELAGTADGAYDAVVAYNGALSFALKRRDRALAECGRVLRAGGVLALDVLSLWGTLQRRLPLLVRHDLVHNRAVIRSGDLLQANRKCHLFRAAELKTFLCRAGFEMLHLSASSFLSTGMAMPASSELDAWSTLLEYERAACVEQGCLDGGNRLIAVVRRC